MDPDITVKKIIDCCEVMDAASEVGTAAVAEQWNDTIGKMDDLVFALREWIKRGGFKPSCEIAWIERIQYWVPDFNNLVVVDN